LTEPSLLLWVFGTAPKPTTFSCSVIKWLYKGVATPLEKTFGAVRTMPPTPQASVLPS
jgi:hypothetical protein